MNKDNFVTFLITEVNWNVMFSLFNGSTARSNSAMPLYSCFKYI